MSGKSAPVIVIGGGIVSASIAWYLAKEEDVIIIAEAVSSVATPNSFCWLNTTATTEKYYYDFRRRSMARWEEMCKELPDLPIYRGGTLTCNRAPDECEELYKLYSTWELEIDHAQFSSVEWGLYTPEEGTIEAHIAAARLIAYTELLGTKVVKTSIFGFLKYGNGRVSGVVTGCRKIYSSHIVLAAGLGSILLLATENIKLHLNSSKGLLISTVLTKKRYLNTLVRLPELYIHQALDSRICFGASFTGRKPGNNLYATAEELFKQLQKVFKNGSELEFSGYTLGVRPDPEDGYPILGLTGLEGLDVVVMYSGVINAVLVGELLSKKILYRINDPMLDYFRLD